MFSQTEDYAVIFKDLSEDRIKKHSRTFPNYKRCSIMEETALKSGELFFAASV